MFNKIINMSLKVDDYEILDNEFIKTASEVILPDGYDYDPDFLYIKVRAISAGEYFSCNKNGDYFPEQEILDGYKTFLDAHVFKNHDNKQVEKAIGDVMDAIWDDEMKHVELFIRINRKVAPTIVAGFEKGYMTDVSMGCRVDHTICSICGNVAKTPAQYCQHIRQHKHEILEDGRKVMEINIGPKFHDISVVLNGADRTAKMTAMYVSNEKRASLEKEWGMSKVASFNGFNHTSDKFFDSFKEEKSMQKVASEHCIQYEYEPEIFEKRASNVSVMEKIAEIKKQIKGNVLRVANSEREIRDEKAKCHVFEEETKSTPIMSLEQMDNVGKKICEISEIERVSPIKVLNMFFKLSALSGRIFSPSETVGLMKRVTNRGGMCSYPAPMGIGCSTSEGPLVDRVMSQMNCSKANIGLNGIVEVLGKLFGGTHINPGFEVRDDNAMSKGKVMVVRVGNTQNVSESPITQPSVIMRIIKLACDLRDGVDGFDKIASTNVSQADDYNSFTYEPTTISQAIEKIAYSTYLDNMCSYMNSKDFNADKNIYSFEREVDWDNLFSNEKVAKTKFPIASAITPGILAYSYARYNGAKAREGKPLSTVERFTAENPETVGALGAISGYSAAKTRNTLANMIGDATKASRRRRYKVASEDLELINEILNMEKVADVNTENDFIDNLDLFKDENIDDMMKQAGYSTKEVENIKLATVLYAYERQDVCDNVLNNGNLDYNDIENFLKVAIEYTENNLNK